MHPSLQPSLPMLPAERALIEAINAIDVPEDKESEVFRAVMMRFSQLSALCKTMEIRQLHFELASAFRDKAAELGLGCHDTQLYANILFQSTLPRPMSPRQVLEHIESQQEWTAKNKRAAFGAYVAYIQSLRWKGDMALRAPAVKEQVERLGIVVE